MKITLIKPKIGYNTEKSFNEKHVRYEDITRILEQLSIESVISVFHFMTPSKKKSFKTVTQNNE